ncbi:MAG: cytochrome b/b6 domain-containing protein [Candidatus Electrothrix sp. AR3]|nr:cytochrome b/b6 domain-containing protein [Candidatus Electrothrix sp. AR3]
MDKNQNDNPATRLTNAVKGWHIVMIVFCLAALLTGDLADDYKKIEHAGFWLHGSIGLTVFLALCLYFIYGVFGPNQSRFAQWFPLSKERLRQSKSDLKDLARFRLPEYKRHQGLAGLVQFFGIIIFSWLAASGTLMYFFLEPGTRARGILHGVMEAHEGAVVLIPLYLCVHVGAVIAHSLTGHPVWKEIFFQQNSSSEQHPNKAE